MSEEYPSELEMSEGSDPSVHEVEEHTFEDRWVEFDRSYSLVKEFSMTVQEVHAIKSKKDEIKAFFVRDKAKEREEETVKTFFKKYSSSIEYECTNLSIELRTHCDPSKALDLVSPGRAPSMFSNSHQISDLQHIDNLPLSIVMSWVFFSLLVELLFHSL